MSNKFLELYRSNRLLGTDEKRQLIELFPDDLCFDSLFTKADVAPKDIASILRNYGWFWVIADSASGNKDIVVNDIVDVSEANNATVRYFDFNSDIIQECNFSDFLIRFTKEGNRYNIIRLKRSLNEAGADPVEKVEFFKSLIENPHPKVFVEPISYGYVKSNGTRCEVTEGMLKNTSKTERVGDKWAQRTLSRGTGDDAGHRGARELGFPGDIGNLALQNRIQNRWGTWRALEIDWKAKVKSGVTIFIRVTDLYKPGAVRPYYRLAEWREISVNANGELVVEDFIRYFLNTRSFTYRKPGGSQRIVYSKNPATFTSTAPIAVKHRITAGVLLGIEAVTIGISIYNAITGIIATNHYIEESIKRDSLKELNWWLGFDIEPEIALVEDNEIIQGISSKQAYEIINRIGTASNDPDWDKVVITNVSSAYLEQLAVLLSQDINLMQWMIVVGNPDLGKDWDADEDEDKIGSVDSKLSRVNGRWFYRKWDSVREKMYPYPMPSENSEMFQELYQELITLTEKDFKKIPPSELYTSDDCYAFSRGGSFKEINFGDVKPKLTKKSYTPFPELPLRPTHRKDSIEVYPADIDTLYKMTIYKWQRNELAMPVNSGYYTFNNPGIAYAESESLKPYYDTE